MKANLYSSSDPIEVKSINDATDASGSDAAKDELSDAEVAALSSLTGIDCGKASVKFGALKSDLTKGTLLHPKGSRIIIAEVSNGVRYAIFDVTADVKADAAADAAAAAAKPASPAPVTPGGVIVPPPPATADKGPTDPETTTASTGI